jgi:hypothetical protein
MPAVKPAAPIALPAPPLRQRPWAALEVEDLFLGLWLLVLGAAVAPWLTADRAVDGDGRFTFWTWLALVGLVVVFLSRGPDDGDLDRAVLRRLTLVGPMVFVLGPMILMVNAVRGLRARRRGAPEPTGWPGPEIPLPVRRTLVLPMEILGEGLFRAFIPQEVRRWSRGDDAGFDFAFAGFTLACLIVGYAVLVAGPRIVAGATLDWRPWTIRFLFYLAAAAAAGELPLPW